MQTAIPISCLLGWVSLLGPALLNNQVWMCSPPLGCRQENPPRFVSLPEISLHNILFYLFLFQTVFLPCLTHKPSWVSAQCLSVQRPSCGSEPVLWRAAISFPGRRDGTRNLHLPFHTSSPLLRCWKGFSKLTFSTLLQELNSLY